MQTSSLSCWAMALLSACSHPSNDHPACSPKHECPNGLRCSVDLSCDRPEDIEQIDAGVDPVSLENYPQQFRDAFCRSFVKCGVVKDLDTCRNLNFGVDLHITASGHAAFDMGKA